MGIGEWAQLDLQSIQHRDYFGHLSIFMFTFSWENKILIGQSTKIFSVKTGFEELKQKVNNIWLTKVFGDQQNFGGSDATNELEN